MAEPTPYFSRELFQFLVELRFNTERSWSNAQKARYEEHVKRPLLSFITAAAPKIQRVNPSIDRATIFRIYRDTRFSKDKTPYKTHAAAQFRHRATAQDVHAPGFYLHLEPGDSFVAGGIWHPEPDAIKAVRARIAKRDPAWLAFRRTRLPLFTDDQLKRAPKGFDPSHPLVDDLKLRSFISWIPLKDSIAMAPELMTHFVQACQKLNPLLRFLSRALNLMR
jgi:uncharacterized protein (TIGR02453 family)